MKPKRHSHADVLSLLSLQIGAPIASKEDSLHSMSIFKAQLDYGNIINQLPDQTHNTFHPLTFMASQANDDILHYP